MKNSAQKLPVFILTCLLFFATLLAPLGGGKASAASDLANPPSSIDETNVLDDLEGSILNGKPFDKDDFAQSDIRDPQIISLVEYGYSFYASRQDDYALYVYIYNPRVQVFDNDPIRNQIQLNAGDLGEDKYDLELLNYSTEIGYEGLFIKFKIALTEREKQLFLGALGRVERVYKVTEFELAEKGTVQNYPCATTYTYKGYAQGYGSPFSADESTLACAVDGFEEYVELDVHQTVYRPKGDLTVQTEEDKGIYSQGQLKDGNQPQLNSCYFRVPKKYFTQYGELTKAICQWYEYMTKPILVTTDLQAWRSLQAIQGSPTTDYYPNRDYGVMVMSFGNQYYTNDNLFTPDWHVTPFMWTSNVENFDEKNYYVYYAGDAYGLHWPGGDISVEDWLKQRFNNLAAIFYKGGVSYWNATVSTDEIKQQLLENSARLGGPYYEGADGDYSQALFTDYVDAGRIRGYNKKEVQLKKNETALWSEAVVNEKFWGIGNELLETPESFSYQQGITIKASDLADNDETIANKLYIAKDDVADLKAEYQKAVANDEELVLLRYALTNYHSGKAIVKIQNISDEKESGRDEKLMHEWMDEYHQGNVNGYLAQETIFLDFDIISLWFATDDAETEIPIMMTPMDVINGLQPGVAENPDTIGSNILPWWFWLVLALVLIVIIIVLALFFPVLKPILAAILKALWWIISAPFRFIAWAVKKISEAVKKRKEEKAAAPPKPPEPPEPPKPKKPQRASNKTKTTQKSSKKPRKTSTKSASRKGTANNHRPQTAPQKAISKRINHEK